MLKLGNSISSIKKSGKANTPTLYTPEEIFHEFYSFILKEDSTADMRNRSIAPINENLSVHDFNDDSLTNYNVYNHTLVHDGDGGGQTLTQDIDILSYPCRNAIVYMLLDSDYLKYERYDDTESNTKILIEASYLPDNDSGVWQDVSYLLSMKLDLMSGKFRFKLNESGAINDTLEVIQSKRSTDENMPIDKVPNILLLKIDLNDQRIKLINGDIEIMYLPTEFPLTDIRLKNITIIGNGFIELGIRYEDENLPYNNFSTDLGYFYSSINKRLADELFYDVTEYDTLFASPDYIYEGGLAGWWDMLFFKDDKLGGGYTPHDGITIDAEHNVSIEYIPDRSGNDNTLFASDANTIWANNYDATLTINDKFESDGSIQVSEQFTFFFVGKVYVGGGVKIGSIPIQNLGVIQVITGEGEDENLVNTQVFTKWARVYAENTPFDSASFRYFFQSNSNWYVGSIIRSNNEVIANASEPIMWNYNASAGKITIDGGGVFKEMIYFNRALSEQEYTRINNYLKIKWQGL